VNAPLLLVGFQSGVLPALRALGRPAFAVLPLERAGRRSAELDGSCSVDVHGPLAAVEAAARNMLGGRRPAAVVALVERTVLVAAQLRAAFGLAGNTPGTALACADKVAMKRAMNAAGVPVAPWCEVGPGTSAEALVAALGLPVLLKPRRDSGGRGQRRLTDSEAVAGALDALAGAGAHANRDGWLAEGWLDGVEMSIEAFVLDGRPVFWNLTEYYVPRHANILPARLAGEQRQALCDFAARALAAAGVERGLAHLELFRTARGPVFGELALRPPGGRLMKLLARAWDFDPWEALLRLELGEPVRFPSVPRRTAGAWLLHPGAGTVRAVRGLAQARALPHVRRIALKVKPGDTIPERVAAGQDVGAVYAEGPDRDSVAAALSAARALIEIELG